MPFRLPGPQTEWPARAGNSVAAMQTQVPHTWPQDEREAIALQERLRPLVDHTGPGPQHPRLVAGLDVAYSETDRVAAAVVVIDTTAVATAPFPYVPGLFAFRELPVLLTALESLRATPEVLLCDGHGLAHPRRFGLACHLGLITGVPAVGVAKTPFTGMYDPASLGPRRGDHADLLDGSETVGRALRTQPGVKPVHVSTGHLIDLDTACRHVLSLAPEYRLPETTRLADRLSRDALRAART